MHGQFRRASYRTCTAHCVGCGTQGLTLCLRRRLITCLPACGSAAHKGYENVSWTELIKGHPCYTPGKVGVWLGGQHSCWLGLAAAGSTTGVTYACTPACQAASQQRSSNAFLSVRSATLSVCLHVCLSVCMSVCPASCLSCRTWSSPPPSSRPTTAGHPSWALPLRPETRCCTSGEMWAGSENPTTAGVSGSSCMRWRRRQSGGNRG